MSRRPKPPKDVYIHYPYERPEHRPPILMCHPSPHYLSPNPPTVTDEATEVTCPRCLETMAHGTLWTLNPDVLDLFNEDGSYWDNWNRPPSLKELAEDMLNDGIDHTKPAPRQANTHLVKRNPK